MALLHIQITFIFLKFNLNSNFPNLQLFKFLLKK